MTRRIPETGPRLAVRAVLVHAGRLLLVNAWPGDESDLWCAPGGGVERGASLPDNLVREVREETGLIVDVGPLCLINEFHDPDHGFHQVEIFFRCGVDDAVLDPNWLDPEGVVNRHRWVGRDELADLHVKPDALQDIAWSEGCRYDPLERIVR